MAGTAEVPTPLSPEELRKTDAYWRACNYLSACMIYLRANPLLREPLKPEHIKNRLLGHWGSDPGQSFDLGALEPPHPEVRLECHLYCRPRPWRARVLAN
jgi:phosphoketolase